MSEWLLVTDLTWLYVHTEQKDLTHSRLEQKEANGFYVELMLTTVAVAAGRRLPLTCKTLHEIWNKHQFNYNYKLNECVRLRARKIVCVKAFARDTDECDW